MESMLNVMKEIIDEKAERERWLELKYPWAEILYNWTIALLIVLLAISLVIWAVNINTQHKADAQAEAAITAYKAEQQAIADAKLAELEDAKKSEEAIVDRWAKTASKMLYGIRNFKGKYNYSDTDYETYLQCVWNRYLFGKELTDIDAIITQKDQFLGYYDSNPVLEDLYQFSKEFFTVKLHETSLACDPNYRWAELTPQGIYLVNEFGADGYVRRWHA